MRDKVKYGIHQNWDRAEQLISRFCEFRRYLEIVRQRRVNPIGLGRSSTSEKYQECTLHPGQETQHAPNEYQGIKPPLTDNTRLIYIYIN